MSNWIIKACIEQNFVDVFVTAETAEEAVEKFKKMDWDDIDKDVGEITDWDMIGEPELNE